MTNPEIDTYGTRQWYNERRLLHRTDGPAVEYTDGSYLWYHNGRPHREGGPAFVWCTGDREWFLRGARHRTDGPAMIYPDGQEEWWINDREITQAEHMLLAFVCGITL